MCANSPELGEANKTFEAQQGLECILNAFTAISIKRNDDFPMWHIVLLKLFERSKMLSHVDLCYKEEQIKVN